jgi:hypothetical protein
MFIHVRLESGAGEMVQISRIVSSCDGAVHVGYGDSIICLTTYKIIILKFYSSELSTM